MRAEYSGAWNVEIRNRVSRPWSTNKDMQRALGCFNRHPTRSVDQIKADLVYSRGSVYRSFRKSIHSPTYRNRLVQELKENVHKARSPFATFCMKSIESEASLQNWTIFSDEIVFKLEEK